MKQRFFAAGLLFLLLLARTSVAAVWYEEYDAGLKAIAGKNWGAAEARLKTAMSLQQKQGRQVLAYGVRFIRYIPEYYLGVVYFNQGKYEDSLNHLQQVQKTGLVSQGDPEFSQMMRLIQLSAEQLKPKTEESRIPVPPPEPVVKQPQAEAPKTEPAEKEIPPPSETKTAELRKPDLEETLDSLSKAISKKDWVTAQKHAQQAASLDPRNREVILSQPLIEQGLSGLKAQELEDRALLAFFSAEYDQAIVLLERLITDRKDSAETWFYLGCSHATLGLLKGKEGQELLQNARREFAQARKLDPKLRYTRDLISPRIVEIYKQSQ